MPSKIDRKNKDVLQRGKAATRTGRWGKLTLSKENKEIPLSTYLH